MIFLCVYVRTTQILVLLISQMHFINFFHFFKITELLSFYFYRADEMYSFRVNIYNCLPFNRYFKTYIQAYGTPRKKSRVVNVGKKFVGVCTFFNFSLFFRKSLVVVVVAVCTECEHM